ncbi:MAG: YitT family protein, partial [Tannerella sp.]|nr:YitT family protein [Tannerella sp.]
KIYHPIKDYIMIFLGTAVYAFGFNGFILSNEIVPGGLTGIGSLIFYVTKIPVSVSYASVNVVLLFLAFKLLGRRFVVNSLFGIISLTLTLIFFEWLLDGKSLVNDEPFMSILIGGAFCGAGLGIIFSANGSTGGTDIIGAVINKHRNISIGRALLYCDFVIIACSYLVFRDIDKIVFGYVAMFTEMYILDRVLNANNQSVQFLIFSLKYQEIADCIIRDMERGCTILNGEGGFSKQPVKVVVLLAKKRETAMIFRLIKSIDNDAFISQCNVQGVYGEGFDRIKA